MATADLLTEDQKNPSVIKGVENKEDIQLIWLDANINDSMSCTHMKSALLALNPVSQFFTDIDQCVIFIKTIRFERVVLIVSGAFAGTVLPQIHSDRTVAAIFIFCDNYQNDVPLLDDYELKIKIFTDQDSLLMSIRETISLIRKQTLVFNLFDKKQKTTRDLSRESASFLWHQMLLFVLKQMPQNEQSKKDIINMCLEYYWTDANELIKINEFQSNYTSSKAIEWYTDECFLYKLLNKALRTENIELLYSFRFFIIDLCGALEEESRKLGNKGPQILYRGQNIPTDEFEKLKQNVGTIISINGFFSTSRDVNVAIKFARKSSSCETFKTVLFEIQADASLSTVVFADIQNRSLIADEQEVLFNLNAVFKIDTIQFDSTLMLWKVQITATNEGSDKIEQYINLSKEQMEESTPMIYFGRLLRDELGQIDRAEKYFYKILESLPTDDLEAASIYNQIGIVHQRRSELKLALKQFEHAYDIRQQKLPSNHPHIAASLYNIGTIHRRKENFDLALDYFQQALKIYDFNYPGDNMEKITVIECIGRVYSDKNELDTALVYFTRALDMHKTILPDEHPNIARCLGAIGWVHRKKNNLDLALDYFHQMFTLEDECLPPDHPTLSAHLIWITDIYKKMNDIDKALKFCYDRLSLQKNLLPENHPSIARTLMTVGSIAENNDLTKALECYEQALIILESSKSPDNQTLFYCLSGMGRLYNKRNMVKEALESNLKAAEYHRLALSQDHTNLGDLFKNIAFCYRSLQNKEEAIRYFNKSLAIYRINYPEGHEKIKQIESQLGRLTRTQPTATDSHTTQPTATDSYTTQPTATDSHTTQSKKNKQTLITPKKNSCFCQ